MPTKTRSTPVGLAQSVAPKGYDQVVSFLSDQLRAGVLKVGDRLLPERELALQLNISRPLVREALRALAMIGVLEVQQGRGTFVRSPDFSTLSNVFTFMFVQDGEELDDIMELRQGIERQAIRLACVRARTNDFEKIGAALQAIHTTIDDAERGGQADFDFHTRLVEASHSAALIKVYKIISSILRNNHVVRRRRIAATGRMREFIIDHHDLLFRAVQRRDVEASERLLSEHFAIGEELSNEGLGRVVAAG
jgi:DNA-binding FadR family transcriptional regulator